MKRKLLIQTLALLLVTLPGHAAGPLKSNFSFDAKSRDALVIVEVAPQKIVESWQISLNQYSPESKQFTGSIYKGFPFLQYVEGQEHAPRFFAGIVKRGGTHILYAINTQAMWGACFDKGARVFTFEPGKVYYLGVVDPNEGLTRIATELTEGDPPPRPGCTACGCRTPRPRSARAGSRT